MSSFTLKPSQWTGPAQTKRAPPRPSQKDFCIIAHTPRAPKTGPIYRDTTELLQHPELETRKPTAPPPEFRLARAVRVSSSGRSEFRPLRLKPTAKIEALNAYLPQRQPCPFLATCAILKFLTKNIGPDTVASSFGPGPTRSGVSRCASSILAYPAIFPYPPTAATKHAAHRPRPRTAETRKPSCYTSGISYGTRSTSFEFRPFRVTAVSPTRS